MPKFIDLTGQRFGKLTAVKVASKVKGHTKWECVCDCGNKTNSDSGNLRGGQSTSCGYCTRSGRNSTHGKSETRLYRIWLGIRNRCFLSSVKAYPEYGGRGITVCNEWKEDFTEFYEWSIANGYDGNLWIDRIDNNGNYEPSNCRWATILEQANNKRSNHPLTINGITKNISEWSMETGIREATISQRAKLGHIGDALIRPVRKGNYGKKNMRSHIEQG